MKMELAWSFQIIQSVGFFFFFSPLHYHYAFPKFKFMPGNNFWFCSFQDWNTNSVISINLLSPLPNVIRTFCDTSWLVHSRFKDEGEAIWETICSWAMNYSYPTFLWEPFSPAWVVLFLFLFLMLQGSRASYTAWSLMSWTGTAM